MSVYQHLIKIIGKRVHKLEFDPVVQFKFNFFFTWFWFLVVCVVPFFRSLYSHNLGILIIEEVSFWANFISHFTALGAAIASIFASGRYNEVPGLKKVYDHRPKNIIKLKEIPEADF